MTDGCEPCQCNLHGSVNRLCNPLSLGSECKKEAKGLQCDTCREHFYGLWMPPVVRPVTVMWQGPSLGRSVMLDRTGVCKPNVGEDAAVSVWRDTSTSGKTILSSVCLVAAYRTGTINGSLLCDKSTGQCPCKLESNRSFTVISVSLTGTISDRLAVFKAARCVSVAPGDITGTFVTHSVASAHVCLVVKEEGVINVNQVREMCYIFSTVTTYFLFCIR